MPSSEQERRITERKKLWENLQKIISRTYIFQEQSARQFTKSLEVISENLSQISHTLDSVTLDFLEGIYLMEGCTSLLEKIRYYTQTMFYFEESSRAELNRSLAEVVSKVLERLEANSLQMGKLDSTLFRFLPFCHSLSLDTVFSAISQKVLSLTNENLPLSSVFVEGKRKLNESVTENEAYLLHALRKWRQDPSKHPIRMNLDGQSFDGFGIHMLRNPHTNGEKVLDFHFIPAGNHAFSSNWLFLQEVIHTSLLVLARESLLSAAWLRTLPEYPNITITGLTNKYFSRFLIKKGGLRPRQEGSIHRFTLSADEYCQASLRCYEHMKALCERRYPQDLPVFDVPNSLAELNVTVGS